VTRVSGGKLDDLCDVSHILVLCTRCHNIYTQTKYCYIMYSLVSACCARDFRVTIH